MWQATTPNNDETKAEDNVMRKKVDQKRGNMTGYGNGHTTPK